MLQLINLLLLTAITIALFISPLCEPGTTNFHCLWPSYNKSLEFNQKQGGQSPLLSFRWRKATNSVTSSKSRIRWNVLESIFEVVQVSEGRRPQAVLSPIQTGDWGAWSWTDRFLPRESETHLSCRHAVSHAMEDHHDVHNWNGLRSHAQSPHGLQVPVLFHPHLRMHGLVIPNVHFSLPEKALRSGERAYSFSERNQ